MTWRDHLLGGFLVGHVFAVTLMALPAPQGVRAPSVWREPTVQAEVQAWADRLGVAPDALEKTARRAAVAVVGTRDAVLAPLEPYHRYAGTWQGWRMFVAPHRFPARLHIDIHTEEGWTPIYVVGSDTYAWRVGQLTHARMRSLVFLAAWERNAAKRARLVEWVARQVGVAYPSADAVRLRYWKVRIPEPGAPESEGHWVAVEQRPLP